MGKPKDPRFRDQDTEDFYNGEKVLEFQELDKRDKQEAHRKVVIIRRAKDWKEIITYFPPGASGSRLGKIKGNKNQHSIRLARQYRLLFCWDKKRKFAYDIWVSPRDKSYKRK